MKRLLWLLLLPAVAFASGTPEQEARYHELDSQAWALFKANKFAKATWLYDEMTMLLPHQNAGFEGLCRSFVKLGLKDRAEAQARVALELNPREQWAYELLFDTLVQIGKRGEAVAFAWKHVAEFDSLGWRIGQVRAEDGDDAEALRGFRAGIGGPDTDFARLGVGLLLVRAGVLAEAREQLKELRREYPDDDDLIAWLETAIANPKAPIKLPVSFNE